MGYACPTTSHLLAWTISCWASTCVLPSPLLPYLSTSWHRRQHSYCYATSITWIPNPSNSLCALTWSFVIRQRQPVKHKEYSHRIRNERRDLRGERTTHIFFI